MRNKNIHGLLLAAIFASVISVLAQISVPIGPVPVTLQTLGVGLTASLLGKKWGTISATIYLLLGLFLPVYANGGVGVSSLFGATGGFLFSFILMAFIVGFLTEKHHHSIIRFVLSNILGSLILLTIGTIWLKLFTGMSWTVAFWAGAGVFIPIEIGKAILSSFVAISVKKALPARFLLQNK
ncbi:biotin transport system substrate-specific component [Pilibacter termitis]|uniref:Biotin transporter n=1 Tax=Pilibacter termitis TaxID=263852 RepID=A0A1T4NQN9_9ENTE|nr:biotin transporter BioY [Pilibacter termitis]SJZ81534.1 biotin transport system substrate-specific component [Pilibacter termitis]